MQLPQGVDMEQAEKVFAENPGLREILLNPKLSAHQKKLRSLPYMRRLNAEHADILRQKVTLNSQLAKLNFLEERAQEIEGWLKGPAKLEKNDHSRLHWLMEAFPDRVIRFTKAEDNFDISGMASMFTLNLQVFVVQHDWASAFDKADDYQSGDFKLPFLANAFEFKISGRNVIVIALQNPDEDAGEPQVLSGLAEFGDHWLYFETLAKESPAFQMAWLQIRAISIALEAEAAKREVVRAPTALNRKREAAGKPPLYDYHIVKLSDRKRLLGPNTGSHRSPRLHFRRGHWRHFELHKTWIKWQLVGNPELGFIDKEYRL